MNIWLSKETLREQIEELVPQIDDELCYCEDMYGEPGIGFMAQIKAMHPSGVAMIFDSPKWMMKPERDHPIHFVNLNRLTPWEAKNFHERVLAHREAEKEKRFNEKSEPILHEIALEQAKFESGGGIQVSVPNVDDTSAG